MVTGSCPAGEDGTPSADAAAAGPADFSGSALRDLRAGGWRITETLHSEGSVADWHEHRVGHFCLVVAGRLLDEGRAGRRECGPGTLLYFPARAPHRDRFLEAGARCLNLRPPQGSRRRADVVPDGGPALDPVDGPGLGPGTDPMVLGDLGASWSASRLYDRIRVEAGPGPTLVHGLADLLGAARVEGRERPDAPDWLLRARRLIEEEWADGTRLGRVADRVGVSRFRLARRFRRWFGCSVGEYVHRLRVTRARHLLLSSDASLSEIAFATGFADQSHFTRVFRRHAGTSPARYRAAGA